MKRSGIYTGNQQKHHIVKAGGFSRVVTHFYGSSLAMSFKVFRISKTNLTSLEILIRHLLNHPTSFVWSRPLIDRWAFCSRCWDICSAHCTDLELSWTFPIWYLLHITSKIYVFVLLPYNFLVCDLKLLILRK